MTLKEMAALCEWDTAPQTEAGLEKLFWETARRLHEALQAEIRREKSEKPLTLLDFH